jgi:hypothetical protein
LLTFLVRLPFGVLFCLHPLTSLILLGWLARRTQGLVLYRWWRKSLRPLGETFADVRVAIGAEELVPWPRWMFARCVRRDLGRSTRRGTAPGLLRQALRLPAALVRGLAANAVAGMSTWLATVLLTGWGCGLMAFGWEFGWLNSFHKGYEQPFLGAALSWLGILLFALAMVYVPMAQVHQAVTGRFRDAFDLRFLARLVQARPLSHLALAVAFLFIGSLFEILKSAPAFFPQVNPALEVASDQQLAGVLRQYYLACAAIFFPSLLLLRGLAVRTYASSVPDAVRQGRLARTDLPTHVANWFDRLGLPTSPQPRPTGVLPAVMAVGRGVKRRFTYVAIVIVWVAFAFKVYVGEFLNYHPGIGFLNHPFIHLPYVSYIPGHLQTAGPGDPP